MHLFDKSLNFLGGHGIVGGHIPLAAGVGWAIKYRGGDQVCVCFFAETLGTNNPKISRHLAYLKRAGLVTGRRDGKWIHYSLTPPDDAEAAELLASILKTFETDNEMQADKTALINVCCSASNSLVSIRGRG